MDSIQKLYSDIEKTKKFYRANHPVYDGIEVCRQVVELFAKNNRAVESLAGAFADYWFNTYIVNSTQVNEEPVAEHIEKLCAFEALLENREDELEAISEADFKELCALTNYEAEDLPIDMLNDLMMIFVNKAGVL